MRPEVLVSGGIAVAAVVLALGWVCILWRRDGQRARLMQLALEKGVTRFPNTPPFWLLSLRQGVTVLALGAALCGVGGGALLIARGVPEPTAEQQKQALPAIRQQPMRDNGPLGNPDEPRDQAGPDDWQGRPFPPPDPDRNGPPDHQAPPQRDARNPPRQPAPPIAVPAVENWHRAQAMRTIGLISLGCGAVLLVLGIVRIAFSAVERSMADDPARMQ